MTEPTQLQFHELWRRGDKHEMVFNHEGIHAEVYYSKERNGKAFIDVINATIWGLKCPRLSRKDFTSMLEAQAWCEQWYLYMSENLQLKKELEHYKSCFRAASQELSEIRAKENEREWAEVRAKYGWNAPKDEVK